MKKLINIIVEDSCTNCPHMDQDAGDCKIGTKEWDLNPYYIRENGFIKLPFFVTIPDWCPLETVEE